MTRSWIYGQVAALLALILICAPSAVAQTATDRPTGAAQGPSEAQLVERLLDYATAELNLTVEQRDGLGSVLTETMEKRRALARNQSQLNHQIREALSDPSTAAEEFQRLAGASLSMRREGLELIAWQQGRLREILTPRQSLRFLMMQDRLARRIEEVRRDRRQ